MSPGFRTLFFIFICAAGAQAQSAWIVDNQGAGDFTTIQAAIDAAGPRDQILVRPGPTKYGDFTINKPLTLQSESQAQPFSVLGTEIRIEDPSSEVTERIVLRGMEYEGNNVLTVENCQLEVILEDLSIDGYDGCFIFCPGYENRRLRIENCTNVEISDAEIQSRSVVIGGAVLVPNESVLVESSQVRMNQITIIAANGNNGVLFGGPLDATDGGSGFRIRNSTVSLTEVKIRGGDGGFAACDLFSGCGQTGDGGYGLKFENASGVLLSTANLGSIMGGRGGDGSYDGMSCSAGGSGGNALDIDSNSALTYNSLIQLQGGSGGAGTPDSRCGPGSGGALHLGRSRSTLDDLLPFFRVTGAAVPGGNITLDFEGKQPGIGLILASDRGGFGRWGNFRGFPLSVLDGTWRTVMIPWPTDGAGRFSLPGAIPNTAAFLGLPMHIQVAHYTTSGPNYMSNAVTRVIVP